ncbi:MAG: DEAD/DEAH box helicase [Bacillota bacterium]|nr:DEAD/DEAH box helicase [Bacillota bacterium]
METLSFNNMGLKAELLQMIEKKGFEEPTPIQIQSIPPALEGKDVMGQAQTGTGKTAAFGIPMLNKIEAGQGVQALVVCPTRELAVQVAQEINSLGTKMRIRALPVYGGQSIEVQLRGLRQKPEIIVGTPGRLMDHMNRRTIKLNDLDFVVLDEADEMLDMGFLPDIEKILASCPEERQTFLFSATLEPEIRKLGCEFMNNPEAILIEPEIVTVPLITQYYYEVNPRQKVETICRVIDVDRPLVSLIFCRTKKGADELTRVLNSRGYAADALHGDMSQRERDSVMDRFRRGKVHILVATDIAARGLDVEMVSHVFNYDIPEDPDSYVHRIGRTGRAGKTGTAIMLVEPRQIRQLRMIENHIGKRIKRQPLPSLKDAIERRKDSLLQRLETAALEDLGIYEDMAHKMLEEHDACQMLAAAIKLLASEEPELETASVEANNSNRAHVELPVGRMQGIYPRKLVDFIAANTSINPRQVGDIEVQSNTTFVEIPMDYVDELYEAITHFENMRKNRPNRKGNRRPSRPRKAN